MAFKSYEERREEERQYRADVDYEVWRSGGNVDAVDFDRVQDGFSDGNYPEQTANHELKIQREAKQSLIEEPSDPDEQEESRP